MPADRDETSFATLHLRSVESAAGRIRPFVRRTPLLETELGPLVFVKPEALQPAGSFKVRGAFHSIVKRRIEVSDLPGVVTASSGNHGQAVAYAAQTLGVPATIVIPEGSNPAKVEATRERGAEVITEGVTWFNREDVVRRLVEERGLYEVHAYDAWDTIHGQGTIALEVFADRPSVGTVVTALGGGGLLAGTALTTKALDPSRRVIGVEPEVADDGRRSLETGTRVRLEKEPKTIADAVRARCIGTRNFQVLIERGLLDEVVTVSDGELEEAVLFAWRKLRLALEPTGALPLAAHLAGKLHLGHEEEIALVLSGGNFNPGLASSLLADEASRLDGAENGL